jgi:hypothetical protein
MAAFGHAVGLLVLGDRDFHLEAVAVVTASNFSLFAVPTPGLSPRSRFRAWRSTSSRLVAATIELPIVF